MRVQLGANCISPTKRAPERAAKDLLVNVFAVPCFKHQNDKYFVLKLAQYAVTAAPVTPDVVQFAFELLAPLAGIVSADYAVIEIGEDLSGSLLIQPFKLLQGTF
jgi:hypothetical protein